MLEPRTTAAIDEIGPPHVYKPLPMATLKDVLDVPNAPPDTFQPTSHAVIDEDTGESLEYQQLITKDKYKETWLRSSANKFFRVTQGSPDGCPEAVGTDTCEYICKEDVPASHTVTYARFVCGIRSQKKEIHRTRMIVGSNLIDYPGDLSTHTSDFVTVKILINSVLSSKRKAKALAADAKNSYLNTPPDRYEYMRVHISMIPLEIILAYNL